MFAACNVSKWCLNFDLSPCESWLGHARSRMSNLIASILRETYHQDSPRNQGMAYIIIHTHTYIYYIMIYISWFLSIHDMVLYGIVLTYVISQHHQTHTQGLELPQDRQGLPHDLRSWFIHFSFPYIIMFENSPPKQEETRGCMTTGRFLAA